MQKKNVITFALLAFLVVVGWPMIERKIWPPAPRKLRIGDPRLWATVEGQTQSIALQMPGIPGLANLAYLANQIALADFYAGEWQLPAKPETPAVAEKNPEPVKKPAEPILNVPVEPHHEIAIGSDSSDSRFNQKVVLTTLGGGVQSLILSKFEQADRLGRPDGNPPSRLNLIPDDPEAPSNLLYHYVPPVEGNPTHPADVLGIREWKVASKQNGPEDEVHRVVFETQLPEVGVKVTKTFTLAQGDYHLGLALTFERTAKAAEPLMFRYQLTGAHGLPIEGEWYTYVYRNAVTGLVDANRGDVNRNLQDSRSMGFQEGGAEITRKEDKFIQYAAVATQYFTSSIVVDDVQEGGLKPRDLLAWARPTVESVNRVKSYLDDITVRVISEPFKLETGKPVVHKYLLYNGPVKVRLLAHLEGAKAVRPELVDRYELKLHLNTLTDYARIPLWSDLLIACTNLMHGLLFYLHKFIMPFSYGLCIILLTVMVRGTMYPLSRKQAIASAKMQAKMQELAPDLKKLEEKYKGDAMALQKAKHELMMSRGVNPMAMMGSCWVLFLQMPIFLGLYYALQESIHFRLAPFLWIKNLAAPDMLIKWGEGIPWISRPEDQGSFLYLGPFFNLLPIIAVSLMIVQQIMMAPPPTDEQQAMQQKMMKYMSIVFGLMFYKMASGLCLYFIASSLWGLAERKLLPKRQLATAAPVPARKSSGPVRTRTRPTNGDADGTMKKIKDLWSEVLKQAKKK